ncbi:MAG: hypothetical protein V4691_09420, partial [Pseudomonadota bacterium]
LAEGETHDATLKSVSIEKIRSTFEKYDVLVIPGFFASLGNGDTCLLGRGGTDLTALFLGVALSDADVRLLKDVDGVYEYDPNNAVKAPKRFAKISWDDLVDCAGPLIQEKTALFAQEHKKSFSVAAFGQDYETRVGTESVFAAYTPTHKRLKIALLGHGTIGRGVADWFELEPEKYELAGILVKTPQTHRLLFPSRPFVANADSLKRLDADIFIDCGAAQAPSAELIEYFLEQGKPVISANKQAIAENYQRLHDCADKNNTGLYYSSSVGGGIPCLELAKLAATQDQPVLIEGILNGTTNYVLTQTAKNLSPQEAIIQAQAKGFAEADPSADIDGLDAAAKIFLLAAHCQKTDLVKLASVKTENFARISQLSPKTNEKIRQIARAEIGPAGTVLSVSFETVDETHPFFPIDAEKNALSILTAKGREFFIHGKGAGQKPTVLSLMSDVEDARRSLVTYKPCVDTQTSKILSAA